MNYYELLIQANTSAKAILVVGLKIGNHVDPDSFSFGPTRMQNVTRVSFAVADNIGALEFADFIDRWYDSGARQHDGQWETGTLLYYSKRSNVEPKVIPNTALLVSKDGETTDHVIPFNTEADAVKYVDAQPDDFDSAIVPMVYPS